MKKINKKQLVDVKTGEIEKQQDNEQANKEN